MKYPTYKDAANAANEASAIIMAEFAKDTDDREALQAILSQCIRAVTQGAVEGLTLDDMPKVRLLGNVATARLEELNNTLPDEGREEARRFMHGELPAEAENEAVAEVERMLKSKNDKRKLGF